MGGAIRRWLNRAQLEKIWVTGGGQWWSCKWDEVIWVEWVGLERSRQRATRESMDARPPGPSQRECRESKKTGRTGRSQEGPMLGGGGP